MVLFCYLSGANYNYDLQRKRYCEQDYPSN